MNTPSFMQSLQNGANDDANSIGRAIVENLSQLTLLFGTFLGVSGIAGNFTLAAAATLVVPQALVTADSLIFLQATNAAAATLQGSNESLYISAKSAGVSFTVATAAGTAAAGGETFSYLLINLT
jgi:hypothetical protein